MKFILQSCLFLMFVLIPISLSAQDISIIDTSSPANRLVNPTIVMTPATLEPNCDSYTGCGLKVLKPKSSVVVHKHKKYRSSQQSCNYVDYYMSPVCGQCR